MPGNGMASAGGAAAVVAAIWWAVISGSRSGMASGRPIEAAYRSSDWMISAEGSASYFSRIWGDLPIATASCVRLTPRASRNLRTGFFKKTS